MPVVRIIPNEVIGLTGHCIDAFYLRAGGV